MKEIKEVTGNTTLPMISVVVPVYMVESYLRRCVESILAQTYKNFELILVDDGSPDNSGAICDEYAQNDSRIHVIHKPNGGVSSARNAGIENAVGTWLCFVDSDDYIDNTYLENFDIRENRADMYIQGYIELSPNKEVICKHQMTCSQNSSLADIIAESEDLYIINSPCFKLYSASIILDNNIRFDEELSYGEDHVFSLEYLHFANQIAVSQDMGYFVNRGREGSLTRSVVPFIRMYKYTTMSNKLYKDLLNRITDPDHNLRMATNRRYYKNINKMVYDGFRSRAGKSNLKKIKELIDISSYNNIKGLKIKNVIFLSIVKLLPYSLLTYIIR